MKILVCGAGGFIGHSLVNFLKKDNNYIVGVDLKSPRYEDTTADEFYNFDLRNLESVKKILKLHNFDEIYQLAADMGGAGFVFTGENDADIMHNSASINLNILNELSNIGYKGTIFYSSSACMYPEYNQMDPDNPKCAEDSAYPAAPDSEYGWEKLFSERIYLAFSRNKNINVRIARYHNIFGPLGSWNDGREKAPAAICRKIAMAKEKDTIEIWGNGKQTRSFLFIDDCIKATVNLTRSSHIGPFNIGSEEKISISDLVKLVSEIANKIIGIKSTEGPVGVAGRSSDNKQINQALKWTPEISLKKGLTKTYNWISDEINKQNS